MFFLLFNKIVLKTRQIRRCFIFVFNVWLTNLKLIKVYWSVCNKHQLQVDTFTELQFNSITRLSVALENFAIDRLPLMRNLCYVLYGIMFFLHGKHSKMFILRRSYVIHSSNLKTWISNIFLISKMSENLQT